MQFADRGGRRGDGRSGEKCRLPSGDHLFNDRNIFLSCLCQFNLDGAPPVDHFDGLSVGKRFLIRRIVFDDRVKLVIVLGHRSSVLVIDRPKLGRFRLRKRYVQRDYLLFLSRRSRRTNSRSLTSTPVGVSLCAKAELLAAAKAKTRTKHEMIIFFILNLLFDLLNNPADQPRFTKYYCPSLSEVTVKSDRLTFVQFLGYR